MIYCTFIHILYQLSARVLGSPGWVRMDFMFHVSDWPSFPEDLSICFQGFLYTPTPLIKDFTNSSYLMLKGSMYKNGRQLR